MAPWKCPDCGVWWAGLEHRCSLVVSADCPLTAAEACVLQLAAQGFANKQIAARLHISEQTVKNHNSDAFRRLGVASRVGAFRVLGWLRVEDGGSADGYGTVAPI